eukprot:Rmarinus@m.7273
MPKAKDSGGGGGGGAPDVSFGPAIQHADTPYHFFVVVATDTPVLFNMHCKCATLLQSIKERIHTSKAIELCDSDGNVMGLAEAPTEYADTMLAAKETYNILVAQAAGGNPEAVEYAPFLANAAITVKTGGGKKKK